MSYVVCLRAKSLQLTFDSLRPCGYSPPGSPVLGILQAKEYWSGLLCLPPRDLPDLGIEPASPVAPALQADSLPLSHWGSPLYSHSLLHLSPADRARCTQLLSQCRWSAGGLGLSGPDLRSTVSVHCFCLSLFILTLLGEAEPLAFFSSKLRKLRYKQMLGHLVCLSET